MTGSKVTGRRRPLPKTKIDPDLAFPPVISGTAEAKRVAAGEAANRLAKMTPEEQAAALFRSMMVLAK